MICINSHINNCKLIAARSKFAVANAVCSLTIVKAIGGPFWQYFLVMVLIACTYFFVCLEVVFITVIRRLYHGDCHYLDWRLLITRMCRDIGVLIRRCQYLILLCM